MSKLKNKLDEFKKFILGLRFKGSGILFLFFFIGIYDLIIGFGINRYAVESFTWPSTYGIVKSIKIRVDKTSSGKTTGNGISLSKTFYAPDIGYEFWLDTKLYSSNHLSFGSNSYSNKNKALAIANKYTIGQKVLVHYKPDNPGLSVIELADPDYWRVSILIGFVLILLSFPLILISIINSLKNLIQNRV